MSKITHIGRNFSDINSRSKKLCELFPGLKSIAKDITNNAAPVIVAYKDCVAPFITTPARQNLATTDVCKLLIIGANFEQIWNALIHESLPNCHTQHSRSTLTAMHTALNDIVTDQTILATEQEHQVTKLAIRVGDLRTSDLELKYKELENELRVHNINTLDQGTPTHFRALTFPQKIKALHDFVRSHMDSKETSFSTQIISTKQGARQFESLCETNTYMYPLSDKDP
jgi:hypothetical protein